MIESDYVFMKPLQLPSQESQVGLWWVCDGGVCSRVGGGTCCVDRLFFGGTQTNRDSACRARLQSEAKRARS